MATRSARTSSDSSQKETRRLAEFRVVRKPATFHAAAGSCGVKTFLLVLLILFLALVAIKLLPIAACVLLLLLVPALVLLALGISAAAVLTCVVLVLALVLAPIWLPVLAIVGLVALTRRKSIRV